ncbi:MAG: hypothetical protein U9Q83_10165 [Bacteroidota bacterium]|nr:hypothetical protein [Bacteroidota bacterium]
MLKSNFLVLLLVFTFSANVYSQQDVILNIPGKSNVKLSDACFDCWDLDIEENFELVTFPYPVEVFSNDLDTLKQKAKEMIVQYAYDNFREHTLGARDVIINHSGQFIKIKFDDYVVKTRRKEKDRGEYKIFIEKVIINKKIITCLCKAIDQYMSDNVVVLYRPDKNRDEKEKELYEDARGRLQAEYVNQEYKRTSVQNIDIQPVCEIGEKDPSKINYYRELIQCVNSQQGVDAKIAIVVRDVIIKSTEKKAGDIWVSTVEVHCQAFNTNTNSFVMDEYVKDAGYSKTKEGSIENCIQKIMEENTRKFMYQEAEKYYNYCKDGKDFYVFIPDTYSEDKLVELKMNLRSVDCINVTNENSVTGGTEIKCETWIPLQADIMDLLRYIKPKEMGKIIVRAEYFEIMQN